VQYPVEVGVPKRRKPKTEARRRREITQVAKQQVQQPGKAGDSINGASWRWKAGGAMKRHRQLAAGGAISGRRRCVDGLGRRQSPREKLREPSAASLEDEKFR
jgi:hypothetical protein